MSTAIIDVCEKRSCQSATEEMSFMTGFVYPRMVYSYCFDPREYFRLVHDVLVDEESPTSSKSDPETDCDTQGVSRQQENAQGPRAAVPWTGPGERRRRKLPEIPKNKKRKLFTSRSDKNFYDPEKF